RYMCSIYIKTYLFFFQAEDGIRDGHVTGVQTCALPISVSSKAISNLGSRSSRRSGVRHPVDVGSVSGEDAKHLARKRGLVGANRWHRAHDLFASRRHATGPLGPPRISQATSRYATAASIPATFS